MTTDTDYLVVGCGATALAFVDALFHETDATFTIVDRRHAPGGHWNDGRRLPLSLPERPLLRQRQRVHR